MRPKKVEDESGFQIQEADGRLVSLSFGDLIEIAEGNQVNPDVFLDAHAEVAHRIGSLTMLGVVSLMKRSFAERDIPIESVDLTRAGLGLALRLHALENISNTSWMNDLWSRGMADDNVLPRMGAYFAAAPLELDPQAAVLVFNEDAARAELEPILSEPLPEDPDDDEPDL